jgi:polynucleotide 5'-triphosphatase
MQHKHYNTLLNKLKMQPPPQATSAIEYKHQYLIDSFYPSDNDRDKIRVTRDEKTKEVVECLKKVRLGDINIYSPKRAADWRVSVNVEVPGTIL